MLTQLAQVTEWQALNEVRQAVIAGHDLQPGFCRGDEIRAHVGRDRAATVDTGREGDDGQPMGASSQGQGNQVINDDDDRAMAMKPALRRFIRIARNRICFFSHELIQWIGVIFVLLVYGCCEHE